MKKKSCMSLLAVVLSAVFAFLSTAPSLASTQPSAYAESICAITSDISGNLSIADLNGKNSYYSGYVEAGQSFDVAGLKVSMYKVVLQTDEGIYFGTLNIIVENGQMAGVMSLNQIQSEVEERSVFSIQYEAEPNDSIKKANAILGDTIYGRIDKKFLSKDVDYFKITIPSSGDYAIVLDDIPTGKDYDLYVFNGNSKQIASSAGTGVYEIVKLENAAAGDVYYAKVAGYGKNDYDAAAYRMQYAPCVPVQGNHGNTAGTATVLEFINSSASAVGRIDYPKDIGFFRFTAISDGPYTIYTEGNTDTYGCLYDANVNLLAENDNGDNWNFKITYELRQGQDYFISVRHQGIGTGAYTLHVQAPEGDKPTPSANIGGSFETATPIAVGAPLSGWLESRQDSRYVAFTPFETGSYGFHTEGTGNTYGALYTAQRKLIAENDNGVDGKNFLVAGTLMAGQTYYVQITTFLFDQSNNGFTIHAERYDEPQDELFAQQWYLLDKANGNDINILPAWQFSTGHGVIVAISDSGIDYEHEDIKEAMNLSLSYNYIHCIPDIFPLGESLSSSNSAVNGHGTHVAGIVGAKANNKGMVGVAPDVTLIGYKTLGTRITGNSNYTASAAASINAIESAKENGVHIMNCSFGGSKASAAEQEAIEEAGTILFVVSTGNKGYNLEENPQYPVCYGLGNILAVAAADQYGQLASYSNYGGPTAILAPGTNIYSTIPGNGYEGRDGTSMAAPVVTGVSALLLSENNSLMPSEIISILLNPENLTLLDGLDGKVISGGMVNAYKALANANRNVLSRDESSRLDTTRSPFDDRDVKSVITEIMNNASDDEKTGGVIVKLDNNIDVDIFFTQIIETTSIQFRIMGEIGIENGYLLETDSIPAGDDLVNILNSYDEVIYAEPNYIRY